MIGLPYGEETMTIAYVKPFRFDRILEGDGGTDGQTVAILISRIIVLTRDKNRGEVCCAWQLLFHTARSPHVDGYGRITWPAWRQQSTRPPTETSQWPLPEDRNVKIYEGSAVLWWHAGPRRTTELMDKM